MFVKENPDRKKNITIVSISAPQISSFGHNRFKWKKNSNKIKVINILFFIFSLTNIFIDFFGPKSSQLHGISMPLLGNHFPSGAAQCFSEIIAFVE